MKDDEFSAALDEHMAAFGVRLLPDAVGRLAAFYELVGEHNPLLHLVGPCSPAEFAVRHILESLTLLAHLKRNAVVADAGTGAGLPLIPCLLVREDVSGILIENKERKVSYLQTAVAELGIADRAAIAGVQFQEADISKATSVTCRAIDKFGQRLPALLKWAGRRQLLLFGGPSLGSALAESSKRRFTKELMPLSDQRFLYVSTGG